jgi:hypothetical protein
MKPCKNCGGSVPIIDKENHFCQLCYNHYQGELYEAPANIAPMLPVDAKERKRIPLYSGVMNYFPKALIAVAKQSQIGHDQHYAPEEPLHWDRSKSADDRDALIRHLMGILEAELSGDKKAMAEHAGALAWRACAVAEKVLEESEK